MMNGAFFMSVLAVLGGLAAFLFVGWGAARRIQRGCALPGAFALPLVWLVNSVVGYAVFFAFVSGPVWGFASAGVLLGGLVIWTFASLVREKQLRHFWLLRRTASLVVVLAMAAVFYTANLWSAAKNERFVQVPEGRYLDAKLPGDNVIPYWVAHYVLDGRWGEELFATDNLAGWLLSDRPPLQAGVYLAYLGPSKLLGLPTSVTYQSLGMVLQLGWITGFLVLAGRTVGPRWAGPALALLVGTGMAVTNMAYVWPKLICAGFVALSIALMLRPRGRGEEGRLVLAALAFALALLSHGGALFSAPAFGLVFLARWRRRLPVGIALGILAALCVLGPWSAFQKTVAPPGNNLLKWHLAGQFAPDDRSLGEALKAGYGSITLEEALKARWHNATIILGFHKDHRLDFEAGIVNSLRRMQWYLVIPSAGVLLLGLVGWCTVFRRKPQAMALWKRAGFLGVVSILSWMFWVALLFQGGEAFMHHGSYGTMLLWYLFLVAGIFAAGERFTTFLIVLQSAAFLCFWSLPFGTVVMEEGGSWLMLPWVIAVGTYLWLMWRLWWSVKRSVSR